MRADQHAVRAIIVDDRDASAVELLNRTLERARLDALLSARCEQTGKPREALRIVIKPDLLAFRAVSPTATDPRLVEALIDALHDRGYPNTAVVASNDSSSQWAENRDIFSRAELLGYRFSTPAGRPYDLIDLADDLAPLAAPPGALLCGSSISCAWTLADVRIVFCKNKTDETEAYALGLDSLIGVLPLIDKDYYYRQRFDAGTVALELLESAPPHFSLIDAVVSAHGSGGGRAPVSIDTHTLIASSSLVLADFVGAFKMGIDPAQSRLTRTALKAGRLPPRYHIEGNLASYSGWNAVHPLALDAVRARETWVSVTRTVKPWLQDLDPSIFPLREPVNAQLNEKLSARFNNIDQDASSFALYVTANYALGVIFEMLTGFRMLGDKDAVRQRSVSLGIDPASYELAAYELPKSELSQLRQLLRGTATDNNGLRWRYLNEAVVFEIGRLFPIPFEQFVGTIDVAKTIQFMNDYLGGVVVPVKHDAAGRVTHQAERNLYLPQPNYLVLSGGSVIDVTKLEYVEYSTDSHEMTWKTVRSENASAQYDDGIVTFARTNDGTHVSIFGRQLFGLPPFWQAVNLERFPALKTELVTHAYTTFFHRTFANFEALLEGRSIALGQPWHSPDQVSSTEPLLADSLAAKVGALIEKHGPAISRRLRSRLPVPVRLDTDGFAHFAAPPAAAQAEPEDADPWVEAWSEFWADLTTATRRDFELVANRRVPPP